VHVFDHRVTLKLGAVHGLRYRPAHFALGVTRYDERPADQRGDVRSAGGFTALRRGAVVGFLTGCLLSGAANLKAQSRVSFSTPDGGHVHGDLYDGAEHAVVLAHGGRFTKESWAAQALRLQQAGFHVLAIDFRGYGDSRGPGDTDPMSAPLHLDVLAAVRYLRAAGATTVSVVGASLGGAAAADAVAASNEHEIQRLVLLSSTAGEDPEKLTGRKLLLIAREDVSGTGPRLPRILAQYERVPDPKEMIIVEGSAHAQFLFRTEQAERVMHEILRFLSAP
jgi:alpha/beta superfamily hydrolase